MMTFSYVIQDEVGVHARPAGLLVKKAKEFSSKVTLNCNGKSAEATKLLAVMALGAKQGMELVVTVEGDDEEYAAVSLQSFFQENL